MIPDDILFRGDLPLVPGLALGVPLDDAGAGDVWSAHRLPTGEPCWVRRLRLPGDPGVRDHVCHMGRGLNDLVHPHLVSVQDVVPTRDGVAVVTEPVAGALSLARLLEFRERLEPGEIVTIGLPLAQALAAAHESGVTHGRVTPEDVLLERSGRPVLSGVGVAGLLGSAGRPPDDVRDLAALLLACLAGAVGTQAAAIAGALSPALVDERSGRPSASELAEALAGSCAAMPVRFIDEPAASRGLHEHEEPDQLPESVGEVRSNTDASVRTPVPRPSPARRRSGARRLASHSDGTRRPIVVAIGVVAALALAGVVGWSTAGKQTGSQPAQQTRPVADAGAAGTASPPVGMPTAPPNDVGRHDAVSRWRTVLGKLDQARALAFQRGVELELSDSDAPGSSAFAGDVQLLRAVLSRGAHVVGLHEVVDELDVQQEGRELVVLGHSRP